MTAWIARTVGRIAREQRGFSVVELITVSALLIVVLSATLMVMERTIEIAPQDEERTQSIREVQIGLHRMVRELREAYALNPAAPPTATQMDVLVPVAGPDKRIRYDCAQPHPDPRYKRCLRYEGVADFTQPVGDGQLAVDRILNDVAVAPVFRKVSSSYVEAKVEVSARGERDSGFQHKVVLEDGFFMRNCRGGC